jgi:regulator of RNase E activity RraA
MANSTIELKKEAVDLPSRIINEICSFEGLSTTHFCDAGAIRTIASDVRAFSTVVRAIAPVFTIACHGDLLPVIQGIESAPRGAFLAISTDNSKEAVFGEIFTTICLMKGIKGIVLDGYCRDVSGIKDKGIPFFAKGVCAKAGTKETIGELGTSVTIGDQVINPGDIIFSDENGVLVLSDEELHSLYPKAIDIFEHESLALRKIKVDGSSLREILNFDEHLENIEKGDLSSQLCWTDR